MRVTLVSNDKVIFIDPLKIHAVIPFDDETRIEMDNKETYRVKESLDTIEQFVLSGRTAVQSVRGG